MVQGSGYPCPAYTGTNRRRHDRRRSYPWLGGLADRRFNSGSVSDSVLADIPCRAAGSEGVTPMTGMERFLKITAENVAENNESEDENNNEKGN